MASDNTVERNLRSFNASDRSMEFFGPIVGTVRTSPILALTNAQLLALVTTPIDVLAAPGAGFVIQVVRATLIVNATAGAYTNVQATATLLLGYGGATVKASNAATPVGTLDTAQKSIFLFNGPLISTAVGTTPGAIAGLQSNYENVKVQIAATNAASGNFTGGNAANTGRLSIDYLIVPI